MSLRKPRQTRGRVVLPFGTKIMKRRVPSDIVIMIQKMLELEDYSSIPGYQPHHKRMLRDAFEAWLVEQASAEI